MYYFDNSATTKPDKEVLDTFLTVSNDFYANPSSLHQLGITANQLLNQARYQIATVLNVNQNEIYFTSSGTEANNWVMQSIVKGAKQNRPYANRVLISSIEHPSITQQIDWLKANGFQVDTISVNRTGVIEMTEFEKQLGQDVLLVSTLAVNNEVGSIQPIEQMANLLKRYPQILWHVDGVQAVVGELNLLKNRRIDIVTLSGHKFHSVRGTGILMMKERIQSIPFLYGGGQERGYRSGTENLASIVATAKALRLMTTNQKNIIDNLANYRQQLIEKFEKYQWQVFAKDTGAVHILCVALKGIPGEVLVHAFEEEGIILSTTSACSSRKHQQHHTLGAMGVEDNVSASAIRISMSKITTEEAVNHLLKSIEHVSEKFKKYSKI